MDEKKEKKKIGRPTDNPRNEQYRIRLNSEELEKLNYCSKVSGKSKAEILRLGLDRLYLELKKK